MIPVVSSGVVYCLCFLDKRYNQTVASLIRRDFTVGARRAATSHVISSALTEPDGPR